MERKMPPKYTPAELARFPLVFGGILLALGTAFYYRKELLPSATEMQKQSTRGSAEDRKLLQEAMDKSFR